MTPEQAEALKKFREARDPLKHYVPRPTALRFHQSNARQKLLGGGNRGGKTAAGMADLSMLLRGIHPYHTWVKPVRIWLWVTSRSQSSNVVGRKLFETSELTSLGGDQPMIPRHEIADLGRERIKGQYVYTHCGMRNGSELLFGWSGVESSWKRFQGLQLDGIGFDENSCEGEIMRESPMRVADARAMYADSEPWRGFIYWYASGTQANTEFEDFRQNCKNPNIPDWEEFVIPPSERPEALQKEMESISLTLTEEQRRIRIEGDSTASEELQIYRQWNDTRHMRSFDYVVQPDDNLWCGYDPGVDHPTGLAFCAINKDNPIKLRFVKAYQRSRMTLEDEVEIIVKFLRGRTLEALVYDISSHKTEKTGLSVKNQLQAILLRRGVKIIRGLIPGRNRHKDGIARVRIYLDPDPANPYAEPMVEFNPSEESGCQQMRSQILKYRSFEPGKYTGPRGVVKKDDEFPDVLRYLCSVSPAYNPVHGCGHPLPDDVPLHEPPSVDKARIDEQMRRSAEMWSVIQGRDSESHSISLW